MVSSYFVGQGIKHPTYGWGTISRKDPNDGTLIGRFRDGEHSVTEAELQTALEATPNLEAPLRTSGSSKPTRRPRKTAIAGQHTDLIDFLREHGTIRVQLPTHKVAKFNSDYEAATGDLIDTNTEHYSIIGGVPKWGATLTILFPKEGASLVPAFLQAHQYVTADPNTWCIMDNAFIFELFSIGFKLGKDHKSEGIEIGLPLTS
jgi:hypothetical protein